MVTLAVYRRKWCTVQTVDTCIISTIFHKRSLLNFTRTIGSRPKLNEFHFFEACRKQRIYGSSLDHRECRRTVCLPPDIGVAVVGRTLSVIRADSRANHWAACDWVGFRCPTNALPTPTKTFRDAVDVFYQTVTRSPTKKLHTCESGTRQHHIIPNSHIYKAMVFFVP